MSDVIPRGILEDILSRLPLKAIARTRCISKSCRALIDDPFFANMLLKRNSALDNNPSKIIFTYKSKVYSLNYEACVPKVVEINHPSEFFREPGVDGVSFYGFMIWGSCDGLLGITSHPKQNMFLWNPYTRQYKTIPKPPKNNNVPPIFPCSFSLFRYQDDYKVVSVGVMDVHLYSSGKNSWTKMKDIPYLINHRIMGRLVNGSIHWVGKRKGEDDGLDIVIAYDIESEKAVQVPLPSSAREKYDYITVSALDGCICVVFYNHCDTEERCEAWIMKDYGVRESWTKLFDIAKDYVPLCFMKKGAEILLLKNMRLYVYDTKSRALTGFMAQNLPQGACRATNYTESIVPPR